MFNFNFDNLIQIAVCNSLIISMFSRQKRVITKYNFFRYTKTLYQRFASILKVIVRNLVSYFEMFIPDGNETKKISSYFVRNNT